MPKGTPKQQAAKNRKRSESAGYFVNVNGATIHKYKAKIGLFSINLKRNLKFQENKQNILEEDYKKYLVERSDEFYSFNNIDTNISNEYAINPELVNPINFYHLIREKNPYLTMAVQILYRLKPHNTGQLWNKNLLSIL